MRCRWRSGPGLIDESLLAGAWRLWPVGLIALGAAILIGRSGTAVASTVVLALVLGLLAGGALAAGGDWFGIASGCGERDAQATSSFEADGALASGAEVDLRFGCGQLDVTTAIEDTWHLAARHDGAEPDVDIRDDGLTLRTAGDGPFSGGRRQTWELELPTETAIALDAQVNGASASFGLFGAQLSSFALQTNAGDAAIDLAGAEAARLEIQTNAGRIGLILDDGPLTGRLEVNAGAIELCVPDGAGLRLDASDSTAFGDNFAERGLTESDDVWTRDASAGAGTIQLEIDGNAASVTLNPQEGCR